MRQEVGGPGTQLHSWPHTKAGTGTTSLPGWPSPLPASRPTRQPRLAELMAGFPWAWVPQPRPGLHLHCSPVAGTEIREWSILLPRASYSRKQSGGRHFLSLWHCGCSGTGHTPSCPTALAPAGTPQRLTSHPTFRACPPTLEFENLTCWGGRPEAQSGAVSWDRGCVRERGEESWNVAMTSWSPTVERTRTQDS